MADVAPVDDTNGVENVVSQEDLGPDAPLDAYGDDGEPSYAPGDVVEAAGLRLYEQAREAAARREMLTRLVDAECTFAPAINRPRTSVTKREKDVPTHERLYGLAREQERKLREKVDALDSEYTFRPSLSRKAEELKKREIAGARKAYEILYEKALEQRAKQEEARKSSGLEQCTFTPELSRRARKLNRPGSAVARLYNPDWVAARRSEEHNDPLAAEAAACTFRPEINPSSARKAAATSGSSPVHERLYSVAREIEAELHAAREARDAEALAACSFTPDTSKSRATARRIGIGATQGGSHSSPRGGKDPYARLYAHAVERNQRLGLQPTAEELGCTFKPEISRVSRRISEVSRREAAASDIPRHVLLYEEGLQRQQQRRSEAANRERQVTDDDIANATFTPMTNSLPGKQLITVPVHDRLYENARARQAALAAAAMGIALPPPGALPVMDENASASGAAEPAAEDGATKPSTPVAAPGPGPRPPVSALSAAGVSVDAAASKEMFLI